MENSKTAENNGNNNNNTENETQVKKPSVMNIDYSEFTFSDSSSSHSKRSRSRSRSGARDPEAPGSDNDDSDSDDSDDDQEEDCSLKYYILIVCCVIFGVLVIAVAVLLFADVFDRIEEGEGDSEEYWTPGDHFVNHRNISYGAHRNGSKSDNLLICYCRIDGQRQGEQCGPNPNPKLNPHNITSATQTSDFDMVYCKANEICWLRTYVRETDVLSVWSERGCGKKPVKTLPNKCRRKQKDNLQISECHCDSNKCNRGVCSCQDPGGFIDFFGVNE